MWKLVLEGLLVLCRRIGVIQDWEQIVKEGEVCICSDLLTLCNSLGFAAEYSRP